MGKELSIWQGHPCTTRKEINIPVPWFWRNWLETSCEGVLSYTKNWQSELKTFFILQNI